MTSCASRPSARRTGTTVPLMDPSGVATVSLYAPVTPYCCCSRSGVIAWASRLHPGDASSGVTIVSASATARGAPGFTFIVLLLCARFRPGTGDRTSGRGRSRSHEEELCHARGPANPLIQWRRMQPSHGCTIESVSTPTISDPGVINQAIVCRAARSRRRGGWPHDANAKGGKGSDDEKVSAGGSLPRSIPPADEQRDWCRQPIDPRRRLVDRRLDRGARRRPPDGGHRVIHPRRSRANLLFLARNLLDRRLG